MPSLGNHDAWMDSNRGLSPIILVGSELSHLRQVTFINFKKRCLIESHSYTPHCLQSAQIESLDNIIVYIFGTFNIKLIALSQSSNQRLNKIEDLFFS